VISRSKLEPFLLSTSVAVSRIAFRSHDLYDLDSVNFALAINRFDPRVHQPHPPGYFLYICLGRLINFFVHDANLALVLLSVLASIVTVLLVYRLALEWFGPRAATFAGLRFLFSPLAWFHGTVALTYSLEAAASALLGYLCWRIDRGRAAFVLPTALVLGITAGIRPSSIVFLGPLFLFSLRSVPLKKRILGLGALGLTYAAWFLPMIYASGGFQAYFGALNSLWHMVPSKDTVFNSAPTTSVARGITIVFIYFLCFGAASLAPLGAALSFKQNDPSKKIFTAVWIVPALCFFTFIFLKLVNSGYLLLVAAPVCVWLGAWTADWFESPLGSKPLRIALLTAGAVANVFLFINFPAYCSYRSVHTFEAEMKSTEQQLPRLGTPDSLLIVAFDNHFLGFRHAGYYLPGYTTIEYPEATLIEGKRIFAMHHRDSYLLSALPSAGYSRFVLFPLPTAGAEYKQYLDKVVKLLPAQDLSTVDIEGHRYVSAPIADLPLLFPEAVPAGPQTLTARLYTPRTTAQINP
jgi:hypothetical protein